MTTLLEQMSFIRDAVNKYNKCKNDKERWDVIENYNGFFKIMLDNDMTFPNLNRRCEELMPEGEIQDINENFEVFDQYLGWSDGVVDLLSFLGIESEIV